MPGLSVDFTSGFTGVMYAGRRLDTLNSCVYTSIRIRCKGVKSTAKSLATKDPKEEQELVIMNQFVFAFFLGVLCVLGG